MARSVSRTRKVSKSPARIKLTSPKSEPRKKKAPAKVPSRSRSASRSRGRAKKEKHVKSPKSVSRSQSRGRTIKPTKRLSKSPVQKRMKSPTKISPPKPSPVKRASVKKTPSTRTPAPKTPAPKVEEPKAPAPKPTPAKTPSFVAMASDLRPSRSSEKRVYTSTPLESAMRQRYLRHESSSPSPIKVTPRKQPSTVSRMCNGAFGSVRAAGRSLCGVSRAAGRSVCGASRAVGQSISGASRAACCNVVRNRREILVSFVLLAIIAALTYFILYTDPAKTRAFIHSIPIKVQAWYQKHIARK
ncbi:hypothetical protein NECAME_13408 [Necator americanus]|uniref:Uncharacterized protein n=1 Tax=Necator americanus TaxID=51031 RepID=W2SVQ2_NECAM|nr:hypothetical protein NECAME_13408 [Necator americanus]ETN73804.1 hypothetical protein NECAME_13408 [Necator americanus]